MYHPTFTLRRLAVAAIAIVGIGGLAAPVTSSVVSAHRIRHVTYEATLQPTGGTGLCDPTVPTRCAGTFENVITYTGAITGTSYAVGAAAVAADGLYRGTAIEQFSGTIAGCGTGTVIIQQTGVLDPATGVSTGSWTMVPGTGTGDLAKIAGGSTKVTTGQPAKAWVRCR